MHAALTLNLPAAPLPLAPADTKRRRKPEAPQLPLGTMGIWDWGLGCARMPQRRPACSFGPCKMCVIVSEAGLLRLLTAAPYTLLARGVRAG